MQAGERAQAEAAKRRLEAECALLRNSLAEAQSQFGAAALQTASQVGLIAPLL
jgi:hypothetical protein